MPKPRPTLSIVIPFQIPLTASSSVRSERRVSRSSAFGGRVMDLTSRSSCRRSQPSTHWRAYVDAAHLVDRVGRVVRRRFWVDRDDEAERNEACAVAGNGDALLGGVAGGKARLFIAERGRIGGSHLRVGGVDARSAAGVGNTNFEDALRGREIC